MKKAKHYICVECQQKCYYYQWSVIKTWLGKKICDECFKRKIDRNRLILR